VKIVPHPSDDELERYTMQTLTAPEAGLLKKHLLICQSCCDRLPAEIEFVTAMRAAAAQIRQAEQA
jgi:hypothetical protein